MSRLAPSPVLLVAIVLVVSITGALGQNKATYVAPSGQQPSVGRARWGYRETSSCTDNNVQCAHWAGESGRLNNLQALRLEEIQVRRKLWSAAAVPVVLGMS